MGDKKKHFFLVFFLLMLITIIFLGACGNETRVTSECNNFKLSVSVSQTRIRKGESIIVTAELTNLSEESLMLTFSDLLVESGESYPYKNPQKVLSEFILAITYHPSYRGEYISDAGSRPWGQTMIQRGNSIVRTLELKIFDLGQHTILVRSSFSVNGSHFALTHDRVNIRVS